MFKKKHKTGFFGQRTYDWMDIASIKLAVFAFTLFLVSYVPTIAGVDLRWFWFVVCILAIVRPSNKLWKR